MYYRQYQTIKAQHPDSVLLFRIGDFYETFGQDAEIMAKVCGVPLITQIVDDTRVRIAGVVYTLVSSYVEMLLESGHQVAVADPANDAGGMIVTRAVY